MCIPKAATSQYDNALKYICAHTIHLTLHTLYSTSTISHNFPIRPNLQHYALPPLNLNPYITSTMADNNKYSNTMPQPPNSNCAYTPTTQTTIITSAPIWNINTSTPNTTHTYSPAPDNHTSTPKHLIPTLPYKQKSDPSHHFSTYSKHPHFNYNTTSAVTTATIKTQDNCSTLSTPHTYACIQQ